MTGDQELEAALPLSRAEYETLAQHRYIILQFLRFSEEMLRKAGLTPQQYQALLAIKVVPAGALMTVGELAECLLIQHHSAVGLVDRLEAQKLVERQTDPADRRQVHVLLTERGAELLAQMAERHRDKLRLLDPQLRALLERIAAI